MPNRKRAVRGARGPFLPSVALDPSQVRDRRPGGPAVRETGLLKGLGKNILRYEDDSYGFESEDEYWRGQRRVRGYEALPGKSRGSPLYGPVPYFMQPPQPDVVKR